MFAERGVTGYELYLFVKTNSEMQLAAFLIEENACPRRYRQNQEQEREHDSKCRFHIFNILLLF